MFRHKPKALTFGQLDDAADLLKKLQDQREQSLNQQKHREYRKYCYIIDSVLTRITGVEDTIEEPSDDK